MNPLPRRIAAFFNLFPCPLCGGDGAGRNDLCPECRAKLEFIRAERRCPGCGGPLTGIMARCEACLEGAAPRWLGAAAVFAYRGEARDLIRRYKFGGETVFAAPLGRLAADAVRRENFAVDMLVPIPPDPFRTLIRSYDPVGLFASVAAAELGLPLRRALLRRPGGAAQSTKNRSARLADPRRHYIAAPGAARKISGKRLLLTDDIFTTGATLSAAAKVLLEAGAEAVYILVLARTPLLSGGGGVPAPPPSSAEFLR